MAKRKMGRRPKSGAPSQTTRSFRFFDNREKYLMFVTTTSEKWVVAKRVAREVRHLSPGSVALRVFDAGMGDGTVLSHVLRALHRRFPHVPILTVAKEISMEDVRLSIEKLADRFLEHPELVFVVTNMYYSEAPRLMPKSVAAASALNWHVVPLRGSTTEEFDEQIRTLHTKLASDWQVRHSEKTGNPLYERPSVLILYREDREFLLRSIIPRPGHIDGRYELVMASQPYRARIPAELKVRNVLAPLASALAPGGRMVTVQSYGRDPGMEIVNRIWPDESPFLHGRNELLALTREILDAPEHRSLKYLSQTDDSALFRYHLHTMPSEVGANIGTSTLLAAWNAAVYVAQIDDAMLEPALEAGNYLNAAREVVHAHGGLWFNDESFVISRRRG